VNTIHRILRKPFFGRFEVPWQWPKNANPNDWERVTFRSDNGANLAGLWAPARGQAKAALVLAHPMGKAAKGFWIAQGHADLFRNEGYDVFTFDANGFGESEATSFNYPADVLSAGLYAKNRTPHLPIGLVGASFGAGWGLCSMSSSNNPFSAAVLEGVFPTLPEFWRHYPVAHAALRASQLVLPSLERGMRPELAATQLKGKPKVLLVYGSADTYTPIDFGQRLQKAMATCAECKLIVLPGVTHTYALKEAPKEYQTAVVPFLGASLQMSG
jgi:pimeloyl-ACP methyl ester carboxylesterase